jgi:two-component system LytT family sensor kinase
MANAMARQVSDTGRRVNASRLRRDGSGAAADECQAVTRVGHRMRAWRYDALQMEISVSGGWRRLLPVVLLPDVYQGVGLPGAVLLCVIWISVGTLSFARHHALEPGGGISVFAAYLTTLTCFLPWIALSALVFHIERRFPLGGRGWPRHLAALALISVPVTYLASELTTIIAFGVEILWGLPRDASHRFWPVPFRDLLGHQFLYWPCVLASWIIRALLEARDRERSTARLMLEKSQLETSLRQAELDALRMRLNPHFLFNSLQNISVLTKHDPQTASRMLTRLGDLLRASLRRATRPETTLQVEIALTEAYLSIEQMRFGDRLSSHIDLEPGTEQSLVPGFLLQPLVENAIRHGLDRVRDRGVITIRSWREAGTLVLTITDNGVGPRATPPATRGLGVGLGATCERLARMYPGQHTFSMSAVPEGGTEVRITLPLRFDTATEAPHAHAAAADR